MQLIKAGYIMLEETSNMSMNPLNNHVLGTGSINTLEAECSGKAPMVRAGCKEDIMNS
jgi:hypothetical protein